MSREIPSRFDKIDSVDIYESARDCNDEVDMDLTGDAREIVVTTDGSSRVQTETTTHRRRSEISGKIRFPYESKDEEFFEARQSMSEMSMAVIEKLSTSSMLIDSENMKNTEREKEKSDNFGTMSGEEQNGGSSSSTARVVMMVVVEKNGRLKATEIAPLIDSSLKKLEIIGTPTDVPVETKSRNNENSQSVTSVISVDKYTSVSSVERYETSNATACVPRSPRRYSNSRDIRGPVENGGFFAAMTHAMKMALKNLPGANALINLSRECIEPRTNLSLLSSITESSVKSANVLTSLASSSRSSKRSRDEISSLQSSVGSDSVQDARSPLPKKPRGWKIRAREPIARMRNNSLSSLRGVDSSIGDTCLPISSRTHQSTQTD